jgi:YD repeat-containing protein
VSSIDRAVTARRVLPDGSTLESTVAYSYGPQTYNGISYGCTEVTVRSGSSGPVQSNQRHFFLSADRYIRSDLLYTWTPAGTGYTLWSSGIEWRTEIRDAGGNVISATEQDFSQRIPLTWPSATTDYVQWRGQEQPSYDNRVSQTRKYLDTGIYARTDTFYDDSNNARANNVREIWEYDFDQTLKRRTVTSYLTTNPDNGNLDYSSDSIFLLRLPTQQSVYEGDAEKARTVYKYDNYVNDGYNATLTDYGPSVTGHDTTYDANTKTRGNPTAVGRWLNTNGSTLYTYSRYDTLGNVVSAKDPNGNVSSISYADDFGDGSSPGAGVGGSYGATYALPTLLTSPDPGTGSGPHSARVQYDFSTGLLTGFKDRNNVITKTEYNDSFNRPTRVISAKSVTGVETQTAMYYAPQTIYGIALDKNDMMTVKDRDASGDALLRSWTHTDGFGRTIESWTRHPQGDIKVSTIYDPLGRVSQTSNPYRSAETPIYTTTTYDLAGRLTAVTTPDGATVSKSYDGARMMVTDQAQKKRISETDGLGRLIKVWEIKSSDSNTVSITFPQSGGTTYYGYLTQHAYDVLNNLTAVSQGAQTRTFTYDSLKRLTSATNPESGMMTYVYDPNSNLTQRTDARNITTNYVYDALNRNTTVDYSNTAVNPDIVRQYDGATNGKGRLQKTETAGGMGSRVTINAYDAMGRPLSQSQQFFYLGAWGTSYTTSATYDLAGNVKTMTYPSGLITADYSYDQAGRLSGSTLSIVGFGTYTGSDSIEYNAAGQMIKERFGTRTPLYHNLHYNNRLQLVDTRLGDSATDEWNWSRGAISFLYGTNAVANGDMFANDADNNGNLRRQLNYVPLAGGGYVISQQHDYYYDALNRIAVVREQQRNANGQWADSVSQAYSYDRWGNRTLDLSGGGGGEVVWVDDALPAGATAGSDGGDSWTWVSSNPSPYSGAVSHQSNIAAGEHQHFFYGATQTLQVNAGDRLYAYVYLDPANTPSEVMLQWNDGSGWEHRAYWGANNITWGTNGTASRRYMGPLPQAGGWVRLEVPASAVGLEGKTVNGMAFTLYDGRATWDKAGKVGLMYGVGPPINNGVYTVDAGSNRLTSVDGVAMSYDAAGNQTNDGSGARTYDAENRLLTATNGGVGGSYTYDANGKRVRRTIGGLETWQVYGIGGELLVEYAAGAEPSAPQKVYGYRNGQLLVVADASETGDRRVQWLVQDHLGSTRMVVDGSGSLGGIRRHDFAPFGEELSAGIGIRSAALGYGDDSIRQKFGSKERDIETGLDYFGARYFAGVSHPSNGQLSQPATFQ